MKPWPDPVEKKRAVLCEVNAFIARIMDKKNETCSSGGCTKFNSRAIAEAEEGRELMKKALSERFPEAKKRKKRAEMVPPEECSSHTVTSPEERVLHQEINVPELKSILQSPSGWSARDLATVQALVDAAPEGTLTVIYSRRYAGRWYARGVAQLQNCKKEIRARALKCKGFGLDICASYPSILSGITSEVIRRRGSVCMLDETREMTRDTKSWRAAVAKQLGVTIPVVKKGVQALLFGMNSKKWRRGQGIPDNIRSPSFDRLEKEIKEARMLITDDEIKAGRASPGDKPAKILSRTAERVEEEIIAGLISHLKEQGWVTSSLIHDEIVVQQSNRFFESQ